MATFKPIVLASYARSLRMDALEQNFDRIVGVLGGDSYTDGVLSASAGALTAENFRESRFIPLAALAAPKAHFCVQARIASANLAAGFVAAPAIYGLKDYVASDLALVSARAVFGAGPAAPPGADGILRVKFGDSADVDTNFTAYGPLVAMTPDTPLVGALATGDGTIRASISVTGGGNVSDVVFQFTFKMNHVQ
jgi:hypothetical protein